MKEEHREEEEGRHLTNSRKIINDYIYKRMGHKRIKYDESA